jgi:hypothetical protein
MPKPSVQELSLLDSEGQVSSESLRAAITAARYRVRRVERAATPGMAETFYAANPGQRYTAYFTPEAMELARQPQPTVSGWRLRVELQGYGYGERLVPLGAGILADRGNRIDYQRPAAGQHGVAVSEWYINRAGDWNKDSRCITVHRPTVAGKCCGCS